MYLERLEIQGFKSFANKTVLEFSHGSNNQSITAVVGPNGAGKSNIVDAIRWVLGEQSLKLIRGKKAHDVIFFGSKKKASLSLAEVSLYLNNGDKSIDLDYEQIIITRRVFRNGESEYLINKSKARLQDVLLLLAKANFGHRTYGIIGQGMVDSIFNFSYEQRQEFFNEATNIKQFQIKREQSLNKLEKTEENLIQAELLSKEIEPRLKNLTRQIKKLEKREALEEELKKIQLNYYSSLRQKIKLNLDSLEKQIKDKRLEEDKQERIILNIGKELENLRKRKGRSDNFNELQKKLEMLSEKRNLVIGEKISLQNKLPSFEKDSEQELVWQQKKWKNLEQELIKLNEEKKELEKQIKSHRADYEEKQKLINKIDSEINELNQKIVSSRPTKKQDLEIALATVKTNAKNISSWQKALLEKLKQGKDSLDLDAIRIMAQKIDAEFNKLEENLNKIMLEPESMDNKANLQIAKLFEDKKNIVEQLINSRVNIEIIEKKNNFIEEKIKENEKEKEIAQTQINLLKQRLYSGGGGQKNQRDKIDDLENQLSKIEAEITEIKNTLAHFNQEEEKKEDEVFALQKKSQEEQVSLDKIRSQLSEIKINLAKIETRLEDLEKEIAEELGNLNNLTIKTESETEEEKLKEEIGRLKKNLEAIGEIDQETMAEYKETKERFDFLTSQSADLKDAISSLENVIKELDELIKKQFEDAFSKINQQFNKYFKILFNGGSANLTKKIRSRLTEETEAEQEQKEAESDKSIAKKFNRARETMIEIQATPPGKKIKSVNLLSGGERALTALALICAIISNNPSPFIVLDEVDAALDEANSKRFAKILEDLSQKTQTIAITHNRNTMQIAQQLYGLTMTDEGVSKLISLKLEEQSA